MLLLSKSRPRFWSSYNTSQNSPSRDQIFCWSSGCQRAVYAQHCLLSHMQTQTHKPRNQNKTAIKTFSTSIWFNTEVGWKQCRHTILGVVQSVASLWIYQWNHPHFIMLSQGGMLYKKGRDWRARGVNNRYSDLTNKATQWDKWQSLKPPDLFFFSHNDRAAAVINKTLHWLPFIVNSLTQTPVFCQALVLTMSVFLEVRKIHIHIRLWSFLGTHTYTYIIHFLETCIHFLETYPKP